MKSHRAPLKIAVVTLAAGAVAIVVACSGSSGTMPPAGCSDGDTRACVGAGACSGGQSCSGGAWSACDCGSSDAGADSPVADAAAEAAPAPTHGGTISLSTDWSLGWSGSVYASQQYGVGGAFYTPYPLDISGYAAGSCQHQKSGPCEIIDCPPGATAPTQVKYGAGTLSITGASVPLQLSAPYTANGTKALWNGGEVIHATATGSDTPPFDMKVIAPHQVHITAPAQPTYTGNIPVWTLDRTKDLAVTWNNGVEGDVTVLAAGSLPNNHFISVSCSFPASSGMGTIPAAVVAQIPTTVTNASRYTFISINSYARVDEVHGDWALTLSAQYRALFDLNGRAAGGIELFVP